MIGGIKTRNLSLANRCISNYGQAISFRITIYIIRGIQRDSNQSSRLLIQFLILVLTESGTHAPVRQADNLTPLESRLMGKNTGESDISWVTLYMNLTNEEPSFLSKRLQSDRGYWSTAYGPQSCVIGK